MLKYGGSRVHAIVVYPDVVPDVVCVSVIPPSGTVIISNPLLHSLLCVYDLYNN